jgi:hypothetical protein
MAAGLNELQALLMELYEFGAQAEDHEITKRFSLGPLIEQARNLGIMVSANMTLDELRDAVEEACERTRNGQSATGLQGTPIVAKDIFGNEAGIPGDGP